MTTQSSYSHFLGLSKKSDEIRQVHLLKDVIKNTAPTHVVRHAGVTLNQKTKKIMGEYVERPKRLGEVKAAENDLWQRNVYKTGDGDYTAQVPREGSLRAFSLPSKGNKT